MDWIAFNGLTQFLATIATFLAVMVALYQSRSQFRTKLKLRILHSEETGRDGVRFLGLVLRVTNMSNHDVYLEDAWFFVSRKGVRHSVHSSIVDKAVRIKPRVHVDFHLDATGLLDEMLETKHPFIKASAETQDGATATVTYPFAKRYMRIYQDYEEKNCKNEEYKIFKAELQAKREKNKKASIEAWNKHATLGWKESISEKIYMKGKRMYLYFVDFISSLKPLWIVLGIIVFSAAIFFIIIGIISVL